MKVISSRLHSYIDYIMVLFLWISPTLFDLSDPVDTTVYILGGLHLIITLLTNFEGGIIKLIPLPGHGLIELIVAIFLVLGPWILGVSENPTDKAYLILVSVVILLVWLLTDYRRMRAVPSQ